jgi:Fe-S-cluster-containing hydrogenase component 2
MLAFPLSHQNKIMIQQFDQGRVRYMKNRNNNIRNNNIRGTQQKFPCVRICINNALKIMLH